MKDLIHILGIETSCDECSASVVTIAPGSLKVTVQSVATFSQIQIHAPYGGVVPELASRNHLETINAMVDQALREAEIEALKLDAIAVTQRPGLVGALLVGVTAAKAMAMALGKPLIPIHHLEGHLSSLFLNREEPALEQLPLLAAVISGGHTNLYVIQEPPTKWPQDLLSRALVGKSRDDAAGEAFDKTAKLMGYPYPGGVWIDRVAKQGGKRDAYDFPRALPQKDILEFSFSGLKTAVALEVQKLSPEALEKAKPDLCASIQEAIVDALLRKIRLASQKFGCRSLAIVGGVAANSRLREQLEIEVQKMKLQIAPSFPHKDFCTDNAAMIAAAGAFRFVQGHFLTGRDRLSVAAQAAASH